MEGKLLSVIVPIYNTEQYLVKCISSIQNQSYSNLEIILVDDGSTDDSGRICDRYEKKDLRIKVIHKENGGIVSARKTGVNVAKGDYITYVDSDDWIESEMYSEMMKKAIQYDAEIVSSGLQREYADSAIEEFDNVEPGFYDRNDIEKVVFPRMIYTGNFYEAGINVHIYNKIFKSGLVKRYQSALRDEIRIGEDAGVVYPCYLNARRIFVLHKSFYHYVLRGDSCMGIKKENEIQRLGMLNEYLKKYINDSVVQRELLERQLIKYMYYLILFGITDKSILIDERKHIVPYDDLKKSDCIILYGAGKMGKALYPLMKKIGMNIIVWVDSVPGQGVKGIDVLGEISPKEYDKIVIAAANYRVIEDMKKNVLKFKIPMEKVSTINCDDLTFGDIDEMLKSEEF